MQKNIESLLRELYKLHASNIKFGLETEEALLEKLGNPHKHQKYIHVAGTNGKGSVCAMIESILRYTGIKTGLYTSPHLVKINERIRVNGKCIDDDVMVRLIDGISKADRALADSGNYRNATFFEFITALAFQYFNEENVDLVVLETGMGGRLDATNVITPITSVITGISVDHTEFLGATISKIATEKAGIIKPSIPLVVGKLPDEALTVISKIAKEQSAPLIESEKTVSIKRKKIYEKGQRIKISTMANDYPPFTLPLFGDHQLLNVAIAITAAELALDKMQLELVPEKVAQALENTFWPARFQFLKKSPVIILDGAHNPEGAYMLVNTLRHLYPEKKIGLIIGMCADKDIESFLKEFAKSGLQIVKAWPVQLQTERSCEQKMLATYIEKHLKCDVNILQSLEGSFSAAEEWARDNNNSIIVICGSLYLAGEVFTLTKHADLFA